MLLVERLAKHIVSTIKTLPNKIKKKTISEQVGGSKVDNNEPRIIELCATSSINMKWNIKT